MAQRNRSQGHGPALTQRERKLRKASRAEDAVPEEPEGHVEPKSADAASSQAELFPQERLLIWLSGFVKNHFTTDKFIQLSVLAFSAQQAYLYHDDSYQSAEDVNLLISTACGVVALLAGVVIAFRVKSQMNRDTDPWDSMPPWNTIYLVFLPLMIPYVLKRELMLYNSAFITSVLELPAFAKFVIQCSLIGSNTQHPDVMANAKVVALNLAAHYILGRISEFKSLDKIEVTLFATLITDLFLIESEELYVIVLQRLFIAYALGLGSVYGVVQLWKENTLARSVLVLAVWGTVFVASSLLLLEPVFNANALYWLVDYIQMSQTRCYIVGVWSTSLLLLIPTVFNYKIKLSQNSRRKIWHFLVLVLIAPFLHMDPDFVKLALAGTVILFLIVEMVRYLKLKPFGEVLDAHLREFADFRDERGPIIISYIYLFVGIALPILFDNSVVGLVVLGVGDSLASIVGSKWGEIHWSNSSKTLEGTVTFILSTFTICSLFKFLDWFFIDKSYYALLLTCTLSGLLEGNSDMNDNIMIPGFMVVTLESLN